MFFNSKSMEKFFIYILKKDCVVGIGADNNDDQWTFG